MVSSLRTVLEWTTPADTHAGKHEEAVLLSSHAGGPDRRGGTLKKKATSPLATGTYKVSHPRAVGNPRTARGRRGSNTHVQLWLVAEVVHKDRASNEAVAGVSRKGRAAARPARAAGRRDSIVVLAEGATDHAGAPITSASLLAVLEKGLGEEVRVTVLGHVQRGGAPSAFDRNLGTRMGHAAIETLLGGFADQDSQVVGIHGNRVVRIPLTEVKDIRKGLGGTVNDVVLTGVAGGLRRLFVHRGDDTEDLQLRVLCPGEV